MADKVGVPTVSGMKDSMISYGLGLGGGLVYALSAGLFGSGLIGGLLGTAIAGSTIKGVKGEIIATTLGFQTIMSSVTNGDASGVSTPSQSVM